MTARPATDEHREEVMDVGAMHIVGPVRAALGDAGLVGYRALCGARISTGAARNAPLCEAGRRKAGWKTDKRH